MVNIKSVEEIEIIKDNNIIVSKTLAEMAKMIKPGVSTLELDRIAEEFIRDHGAEPAFKGYRGFPNTLCTSINDKVVHGIPGNEILKEGDIISIDCGTKKNGFFGDSAYTFEVGEVDPLIKQLLRVTKECLKIGANYVVEGYRIGDISYFIQEHAELNGYSVVRELVGHGIGRQLHESPEVPNYGRRGKGPKLKSGMVLCVEPMINMGKRSVVQKEDGWTICTADHMPSAHFEYAIAVDKNKPNILTTFKYIEEVLK